MDEAEARALEQAMDVLVRAYGETHRFTATDLCDCHRIWLDGIYEWVGHYRRVNVGGDSLPFAAAAQVPTLTVGFLAQDAPLYASFSVGDHLRLGERCNPGWDREFADRRVADLGLARGQRRAVCRGVSVRSWH